MKKFIIKISIIIPVFIALHLIYVLLFHLSPFSGNGNIKYRRGSKGHMLTRLKEIKDFQDVDILFLGSSHTYRSFDVEYFRTKGISSFNLGSSSQTPDVTRLLLDNYLQTTNPKLVVYEVYPEMIFTERAESMADVVSNLPLSDLGILTKPQFISLDNLYTAWLSTLRQVAGDKIEPKERQNGDMYVKGGYVRNLKTRTQFNIQQDRIALDTLSLGYSSFKTNLELLRKNDVKVLLCLVPMPSDTYSYYSQDSIELYSLFSNLSHYVDLNYIELNDTLDFMDDDHLNNRGVLIMNEHLLNHIFNLELL